MVAPSATALAAAVDPGLVTVVLDPLGGDYVTALLSRLAPGARVVSYGVLAGRQATLDHGVLYGRGIHIFGTSGGTTTAADAVAALEGAFGALSEGSVTVQTSILPLDEAAEAFNLLQSRQVIGKVLLRPGHTS